MKRFAIVFMVLGLIGGSVATAEAEQTFERSERTVALSYPAVPEPRCNLERGTFACVVVDALPTENSFTAKVVDAHGQPVFVQVVGQGVARATAFCGETTQPIFFEAGSRLEFLIEPMPSFWSHWGIEWLGPLDCPYRVATTGTISVRLLGWTTSEEPTSPSPEPAESPSPSGQPDVVERSVNFALRRHLRATGTVVAADALCISDVPAVIQRKRSDVWLDIASTTTDADGRFAVKLADRAGRYRAIASEVGTPNSTCLVARSATVRHQH